MRFSGLVTQSVNIIVALENKLPPEKHVCSHTEKQQLFYRNTSIQTNFGLSRPRCSVQEGFISSSMTPGVAKATAFVNLN